MSLNRSLLTLECAPPWLIARFPARQRMVSWSLNRPGFVEADTVAWLQVSDQDLPPEVDPLAFFQQRLAERGLTDTVGLMTARDIRRHHHAQACEGATRVESVLTLGLTNGVVLNTALGGKVQPLQNPIGTINLLVALSQPLTEGAMLETLSLAAAARTAALLASEKAIIGTGTDCIVIASPEGTPREPYAGLHTPLGALVTQTVYTATVEARQVWSGDIQTLARVTSFLG